MSMQKLVAALAVLFLTSAGAAHATTIPVQGSYTVTSSNFTGKPSLSYDLSHPFTENLTVGTNNWTSPVNFFTASPGSCYSWCDVTGTLTVTFSFSGLTVATGSLTETATYEAKYSGSDLSCSGKSGSGQSDCIDWTGATSDKPSGYLIDTITFTNGEELEIKLFNAQDWNITPEISFDLLDGPSQTPLPATLPLFVSGLGGMSLFGWRRKRKAAAAAAA